MNISQSMHPKRGEPANPQDAQDKVLVRASATQRIAQQRPPGLALAPAGRTVHWAQGAGGGGGGARRGAGGGVGEQRKEGEGEAEGQRGAGEERKRSSPRRRGTCVVAAGRSNCRWRLLRRGRIWSGLPSGLRCATAARKNLRARHDRHEHGLSERHRARRRAPGSVQR